MHIQAGQCGNQIGTKVSLEGTPAACGVSQCLQDAPGRFCGAAVPRRGGVVLATAGRCRPAPLAERRRARSGLGAPRISPLSVTINGFGKHRNQTGLFKLLLFYYFFSVFKLARPGLKGEPERPPPDAGAPQPVRAWSWRPGRLSVGFKCWCPPGLCCPVPSRAGRGGGHARNPAAAAGPGRAAGLPPPPARPR